MRRPSSARNRFTALSEDAARTIDDFAQKQTFLNTVYERFLQGFSKDRPHGIVYTPQPIVDFMVASNEQLLATL
jgi:predicted helicase